MPKVSVIIPAYRKPKELQRAIMSVHSQTYRNHEIIVIDDSAKGAGASCARNEGIRQATGKYIALLDDDDIYMPHKLEYCVDYLECRPECGMVYTKAVGHTARLRWIKNLLWYNYIPNSTVVARRECFSIAGMFDEDMFVAADWDMWLRISEYYSIGCIDIPLSAI